MPETPVPEMPENAGRLVEILRELGYRARIDDNGSIESATSGIKFYLTPFDDESVQFRMGVESIDQFTHISANSFNAKYRFAKIYLLENEAVVLEYDLFVRGLDLRRSLEGFMPVWDGLIGLLLRNLVGQTNDQRASA